MMRHANGVIRGAVLGMFTGIVVAAVGAWKDCLYEDFEMSKFVRTPLVAMLTGALAGSRYPTLPNVPLASVAIVGERIVWEGYKAILRKQPSKFNRTGRDSGWLLERMGRDTAMESVPSREVTCLVY